MKTFALLGATIALAACNAAPAGNSAASSPPDSSGANTAASAGNAAMPTDNRTPAPTPAAETDGCRGVSASGFAAWVNAMPGPGRTPTLIVKGTITTPTGGYTVAMNLGEVTEGPPRQVIAEVTATPPSDGATQAVTSHAVRGDWPMSGPVGSVVVRCGSRQLARISPVESVS